MSHQEIDVPLAKKPKLTSDKSTVDEFHVNNDIDFTADVTETDSYQFNQDLYNDYVMPEELNKLLEYKVLDEVNNEEDSNDEVSDSSDGKSKEFPEEEIEKMLEEGLPEAFKGAPKPIKKKIFTTQKKILEAKGVNHIEVLPAGWIVAHHYSGMPVYMHRPTRVCTLSKPYFLGEGNTRRHDVPISAIPCLAYRKALEEESKQAEIDRQIQEQIKNSTWANATHIHTNNKTNQSDKSTKTPEKKVESADKAQGSEVKVVSLEGSQASCSFQHATDAVVETVLNVDDTYEETSQSETNSNQISTDVNTNDDKHQEREKERKFNVVPHRQPVVLPGGLVMPPPGEETINTSWKSQHLSHEQVNEYCKNLFKFKVISIK